MGKVHYTVCPVCASKNIDPLLTVKDHSVSKESFVIWQCAACSLRFTQDVPDEASIDPYYKSPDYISHTNTGKGIINKIYKRVRKFTLVKKAKLIMAETGKDKGSLLDIGCGTGAFIHEMQSRGWATRGLEPDAGARKLAADLYNLKIDEPSILNDLTPQAFDAITLWHVLEHVHDLQGYVIKLRELLKPEGKLFIAVPNYQSLDASIYRLDWAAYDVPRHLYHFSPKAIEVLMRKNKLRVIKKQPMWFDSFYISLLSSKYRNGKAGYFSSLLNGLRSNLTALTDKDRCSSVIYIISKD